MSPLTPFLADKNDTESVVFPEGGVYTLDLEGATGIYRCQWGEFTFVGGGPLMLRELPGRGDRRP
ncbi:MAG: hypothetical protein M1401_18190 [Chloroflexi bacterium]|nr:hypothetical protein [Chloroflexota bacterium]